MNLSNRKLSNILVLPRLRGHGGLRWWRCGGSNTSFLYFTPGNDSLRWAITTPIDSALFL